MPDDKKTSYDLLLEEMEKMKKDLQDTRKELDDMKEFNRALLAKRPQNIPDTSKDTHERFSKYLEGE